MSLNELAKNMSTEFLKNPAILLVCIIGIIGIIINIIKKIKRP